MATEKPRGRRSSIVSQVVQQEGYGIQVEKHVAELAKQLPQSLLSNAARHSAGFQMNRQSNNSMAFNDLVQATPDNRHYSNTGYGHGNSDSKQSSIPRPIGNGRLGPGHLGRGSAKSSRLMEPNRALSFNLVPIPSALSGSRRSGSVQRGESTSRPQSNQRLSRAMSSDSLFTPGASASQSFRNFPSRNTKSPGKLVFADKAVAKTLKPPDMKDKRSINMLGMMVNGFLQDHHFPGPRMSLDNINKLSLSQYLDACKFTLQLMMGPSFLAGLKQNELKNKLLEMSVLLKYPGTLSNSTLMSPNSSHTWPHALTFLAYLVCRVEAAITPITSVVDPINELKDPEMYSKEILVESFCRLYFETICGGSSSLETELEVYRQRLRDMESDSSTSPDELICTLQQKQQELEEVVAEADPRKELQETIQAQDNTLSYLEKRKAELQAQLRKFEDVATVVARRGSLALDLETAKAEDKTAGQMLQSQKVDSERKKILVKEIDELRSQRAVVEQVNEATKRNLQGREQYVQNAQQRFYEMCGRLNVASTFNQQLQKLEHLKEVENMERIKDNPFKPELFEPWLKTTRRVHRQTKKLLIELRDLMQERIRLIQSDLARFAAKEGEHETAKQEANSKVNFLRQNDESELCCLRDELAKLKRLTASEKENLNEAKVQCSADDVQLVEAEYTHSQIEMDLNSWLKCFEENSQRKVQLTEQIAYYDGPFLEQIQEYMLQQLEARRAIYMADLGIDILANPDEDNEPDQDAPNSL